MAAAPASAGEQTNTHMHYDILPPPAAAICIDGETGEDSTLSLDESGSQPCAAKHLVFEVEKMPGAAPQKQAEQAEAEDAPERR